MKSPYIFLAAAALFALPAHAEGVSAKQAEVMKKLLAKYAEQAKVEFKNREMKVPDPIFSAGVGKEFYLKRRTWQENDYTCSGCHTENPAKEGHHFETKKAIKPLAPAANPDRFTDVEKVEKNFTQHCFDLHDRDCRAHEKGNFITYLMSVK